ncbi:phospholipase D family protein [Ferrovibrio sp.]|uniref:phospholipase D family protein n=1 Tax=Ferrovibrio sp. TaxID=1917215 RepID=UPI0035B263B4
MSKAAFLAGEDLRKQIAAHLKRAKTFDAAIAFWGNGAIERFPDHIKGKDIRIICNLFSGGTNPEAIKTLMQEKKGVSVKFRDGLHAKVYLFPDAVIAGSANFSANGLGLEDEEQTGWLEAGASLDQNGMEAARQWFEETWNSPLSMDVTSDTLKVAQKIYDTRPKKQAASRSILDFDFNCDDETLPFVTWYTESKYTVSEKAIPKKNGKVDKTALQQLESLLDEAIELEHPSDLTLIKPGKWILYFGLDTHTKLSRIEYQWFCGGAVAKKQYSYNRAPKVLCDCMLPLLDPPPPPFNIEDTKLRRAISEVLQRPAYALLVKAKYKKKDEKRSWFKPRVKDFRPFWLDVQQRYRELTAK